MAEFCKDCLLGIMGLDHEEHPEWWNGNDGTVCENCGFDYLSSERGNKK